MGDGSAQLARGLVLVLATIAHRALQLSQEKSHIVENAPAAALCTCQCEVEACRTVCVVTPDYVGYALAIGLGLAVGVVAGGIGGWWLSSRDPHPVVRGSVGDAQLAVIRERRQGRPSA